jgi:hypothetical protein
LLLSILGDDGSIVTPTSSREEVSGKIIEGVFDGQVMIGPDGKSYPVPANYASKSKLVEGDILKLTIADDGGFIYKQIGPIPRRQIIGTLTPARRRVLRRERRDESTASCSRVSRISVSTSAIKSQSSSQKTTNEATWAAVEAAL